MARERREADADAMNEDKLAVTVDEASRMIGLSRATLYGLVMSGEVPSLKVGARRLVPVSTLRTWVEARATTNLT